MANLTPGTDPGGERWHLDNRPIPCGTTLLLRLPHDVWIPVRFELARGVPVLHLTLGHPWERRYEPVPAASIAACKPARPDEWAIYDERNKRPVNVKETLPDGDLVYPELGVDRWTGRAGADAAAALLNLRTCPPEAVFPVPEGAELRWVGGDRG